jgi:hypothetical protein
MAISASELATAGFHEHEPHELAVLETKMGWGVFSHDLHTEFGGGSKILSHR